VTESNFAFVKSVAKNLENPELCEALKGFRCDEEELSSSNVLDRLMLSRFLGVSSDDEIEYLAVHFEGIEHNILGQLNHNELRDVLRSDQLRLSAEDRLLDFLLDFGTDYFDLLGCLHTEYLTQGGLRRLLETISQDQLDDDLWASLCRRLLLSGGADTVPESRFHVKEFPFEHWRPFEGIVSHLTSECGGNVHTEGIVSVTSSNNSSTRYRVVEDSDSSFLSDYDDHSWIQFDFKNRKISPTHYTLQSAAYGSNYRLAKWAMDGSNDGVSWINLDRRETDDLIGNAAVKSYECQSRESCTSFFRLIRLTQTENDASGYNAFRLGRLVLFGKMSEW
jgi:hypothetical protein